MLEGFRREVTVSDLCRREGIKPHSYYSWTKEFMEAGKEKFDSLVKGLFEMSPGVRRWSGAEEATGCRLLASPPYLLRSGQA